MEYRNLGSSEVKVSAITYGAFAIGGTMWGGTEKRDSLSAIHASLDNGITSIDTAPFYGFGLSDELVGEALSGRDRSKIQILTKFGLVWDGSNNGKGEYFRSMQENGKDFSVYKYAGKDNVIKEVEESLRRLRTDYIDLLQLHWPDSTTPISETMEALDLLIQQGKIRAAGVSNYSLSQVKEAEKYISLASNQVPYSMLNRSIEEELIPYTSRKNIGIIAYSPMERGLLTGKYFKDGKLKIGDHRHEYFGKFDQEKVKIILESLAPIADQKKVSLSQLVLKWTSSQKGITVVLAGARNAEQALANAQAYAIDLNQEELDHISSLLA